MKKLMIATALVCAAAFTQAATVSWESGALMRAANSEGGWGTTLRNYNGGLKEYVYLIDAATYSSLATATQSELYEAYIGKTASATATETTATKTSVAASTAVTIAEGTTHDPLYAVVLFEYTDLNTDSKMTGNKDFFMGALASTVGQTLDNPGTTYKVGSIGSNTKDWQAAAVPEPTSGLLLLLGVAGLALRRRRA